MNTDTLNKKPTHYCIIEKQQADQRIDNFLVTQLRNVPKSHIYRLLRKGEVRVNKKRIKPSYRIQENDSIRIPPVQFTAQVKDYCPSDKLISLLKNSVLYEDEDLLIINKPSGIPVHGGSGIQGGVVNALRFIFPEMKFLELAHRLDRETSGCLILAKKRSVLKEIHELLREGKVTKIYQLLVLGCWPSEKTTVELSLLKNQIRSGERMVQVADEGKQSITHFKPLHYYSCATLLQANLDTGRTHQIRVHTSYYGHPVAGDEKYGDKAFNRLVTKLGCKRLFLHAIEVCFELDNGNKVISVQAELPKDLQKLLTVL
jgi:23S rRNA pseudouridine955/2504/2580 synthase